MKFPRITWIVLGATLAITLSAVLPTGDPVLPGVVRLGVLDGIGPEPTLRAFQPLADYLGLSVRRTVVAEIAELEDLKRNDGGYDLALVPAYLIEDWPGAEVLAWTKARARAGVASPAVLVARRGWAQQESPRIIVGDPASEVGHAAASALEDHGLSAAAVRFGKNPYDHGEALAALIHGAYDVAIVRESDLQSALEARMLERDEFEILAVGPKLRGFALVAQPTLGDGARRRIREAALNLDHLKYDKMSLRARAVLGAMGELGLDGFAPNEVLPSLRP